jgi:hypothetical protein
MHSIDSSPGCINMHSECRSYQDANLKLGVAVKEQLPGRQLFRKGTRFVCQAGCTASCRHDLQRLTNMAPLAQLPVRQLSSASPCTSSTRAGNESCNAAVLQAKPWHRGRPLVAQPLQQRRQVVERCFHGCQASSNVSFAVETPGSPGAHALGALRQTTVAVQ